MSKLVTIFGGSGFVGRYIARRMAKEGWRVRVAVRRPNEALFVRPYGAVGQVEPVFCNIRDDASVRAVLTGADAVVNCVGTFDARGKNNFDAIQAEGAGRIARLAAEAGAEEFCMFDGGTRSPAALPGVDGIPAVQGAGVSEGSGALEGAGAGRAADADTPGYGDVLLGLAPPVPDWRRLAALDRVLRQLGECGGGEARAAALTARGWIEWCRGRGSYADALYTAAAMEQPGYRLAELLAELGRRGTLCGWARRKEAAWQKFDPDAA